MENRHIAFSPPDITEEEIAEVADTLRSGWITTGPKTKKFENEIAAFCHTSKAVCLNSATACAEMSLRVLGIGPGDEVITSAYTYTASASVAVHVGATLVLVDTQPDSYEMDYEKLESAISPLCFPFFVAPNACAPSATTAILPIFFCISVLGRNNDFFFSTMSYILS